MKKSAGVNEVKEGVKNTQVKNIKKIGDSNQKQDLVQEMLGYKGNIMKIRR